jgi:hypothetical protein
MKTGVTSALCPNRKYSTPTGKYWWTTFPATDSLQTKTHCNAVFSHKYATGLCAILYTLGGMNIEQGLPFRRLCPASCPTIAKQY